MDKRSEEFNIYLINLGWISHRFMDKTILESSIELAKQKLITEVQNHLVDYYNEKNLPVIIGECNKLDAFNSRQNLIQRALVDYLAGRFYSCVPVLLIIIEGTIYDIMQEYNSEENYGKTAWEFFSSFSEDQLKIAKIFNKVRRKTDNTEITIPYKNGILHGRDLNYANIKVAAKSWSLLFAIVDWGLSFFH